MAEDSKRFYDKFNVVEAIIATEMPIANDNAIIFAGPAEVAHKVGEVSNDVRTKVLPACDFSFASLSTKRNTLTGLPTAQDPIANLLTAEDSLSSPPAAQNISSGRTIPTLNTEEREEMIFRLLGSKLPQDVKKIIMKILTFEKN